ncbi:MAG: hypothetical protein FWH24_06340 [Oscillospiraceae bacterium]|nr:hypothetical protein [Oscillospiraceae bacterium]
MKQSYFTDFTDLEEAKELFPGSETVRKYTFKTMRLGDGYALLAVICPILAVFSRLSRGESALFQLKDCFECLSPTENAA